MPKYTGKKNRSISKDNHNKNEEKSLDLLLERLSDNSLSVIKILNKNIKSDEISLSEFIDAVLNVAPIYTSVFEALEIKTNYVKKVKISDWIIDAYSEAYLSETEKVEIHHLLFAYFLQLDNTLYFQIKKEYIRQTKLNDKLGLKSYFEDITEQVLKNKSKPIILGRQKELTRIIVNLCSESANPTLLVGESGSGKTSIIKELARKIIKQEVPPLLKDARVIRVSFPKLISLVPPDASVSPHLLFSHLLNTIADIVRIQDKKVILFIDDIRTGSNTVFGFESITKDKNVLIIGAVEETLEDKLWEPAVYSMWDIVNINPMSDDQILKILKEYVKQKYYNENTKFNENALQKIIDLHKADYSMSSLPGGGIKTVDMLTVYKRHIMTDYNKTSDTRQKQVIITLDDVESFFNGMKDENSFDNKYHLELDILSNIESIMKKSIIGQDNAIEALGRALRISSLKLQSKTRPIGVFLFLGPTGVGKTETAKVLATTLFGYRDNKKHHPARFLRVDMSEYSEKHSVSKLFGAPPGYIGYDDSSSITDFVLDNPSCVLLFDEIDKAHNEVLNSLLHVMDEGELRNNQGDMVSFEDVVIIMTSNHGVELINKEGIGLKRLDNQIMVRDKVHANSKYPESNIFSNKQNLDHSEIEKKLISNLKKQLKPEFINRLDEIIVFKQLSQQDMLEILKILIKDLTKNLNERGVKVKISPKVKQLIIEKSYSVEYGARELKRTFNKDIVEPVSKILLSEKNVKKIDFKVKNSVITVSAQK